MATLVISNRLVLWEDIASFSFCCMIQCPLDVLSLNGMINKGNESGSLLKTAELRHYIVFSLTLDVYSFSGNNWHVWLCGWVKSTAKWINYSIRALVIYLSYPQGETIFFFAMMFHCHAYIAKKTNTIYIDNLYPSLVFSPLSCTAIKVVCQIMQSS